MRLSAFAGLFLLLTLAACSSKKQEPMDLAQLFPSTTAAKVPDSQPEAKEEPPHYFYPYGNKRDPFTPLIGAENANAGKGSSDLSKGELNNLELKGILRDRKGKVAVIASSDGEPFYLKSGRVYDRKNRMISGVSGIIKESSVVLISRNRAITELSLKRKDEGSISVGPQ